VSPVHAGIVLTTVPLTLALVAEAGGLLTDRLGARVPTVAGMGLAVGGLVSLVGTDGQRDPHLYFGLVLVGLGMGLFIPANNASVMKGSPPSSLGLTGGLINMMRGLGATFGIALVSLSLLLQAGGHPSHMAPSAAVQSGIHSSLWALTVAAAVGLFLSMRGKRTRL